MKGLKLLVLLILIGIVAVLLFKSNSSITNTVADSKQKAMYDNNSYIAQQGDTYTYMTSIGHSEQKDTLDMTYQRFYGSETIWTLNASKPGEIRIKYDSKVKEGRFKAVLISPSKNVLTIVNANKVGNYKYTLQEGEYRIKIIGDNAYGNIRMKLSTGAGITVSSDDSDDIFD